MTQNKQNRYLGITSKFISIHWKSLVWNNNENCSCSSGEITTPHVYALHDNKISWSTMPDNKHVSCSEMYLSSQSYMQGYTKGEISDSRVYSSPYSIQFIVSFLLNWSLLLIEVMFRSIYFMSSFCLPQKFATSLSFLLTPDRAIRVAHKSNLVSL